MKYQYQLLFYIVVFFAGYCSNFLLPVNSFATQSSKITGSEDAGSGLDKNIQSNKNNYTNITNHNKKVVDARPRIVSSQAISSLVMMSDNQSSAKAEDSVGLHNELAMLREYRMQTEINKHNEYLRSRGGNSIEALSNSFKHEPVDALWATEKETLINNVIDQNKRLSQMPHLASECRSKQCKLSVLSDDPFYVSKLSDSLGKIIADHESSFLSYSMVIDEKSHTTSIYFDRN